MINLLSKTKEVFHNILKENYEMSKAFIPLFGVFGLINYPMFYILWDYFGYGSNSALWLRLIATILCILLLLQKYWPKKLLPYFYIFWYLTIGYCLPFIGSYMFIETHASSRWVTLAKHGIVVIWQ